MKQPEKEYSLSDIVDENGTVMVTCAISALWFKRKEGFDFSRRQAMDNRFTVTIDRRLVLFFGEISLYCAFDPVRAIIRPALVLQPGMLFDVKVDPYVAKALKCKVQACVLGPDYSPTEFAAIRSLSRRVLCTLGCMAWAETVPDKFDGKVLMLFPGDWYERIPEGYELVSIRERKFKFKRGETLKETRFGFLPFGILVEP